MKYKNYAAQIIYDYDEQIFIGRVMGIRANIQFHADTVKGLEKAFRDMIDTYLQDCADHGEIPEKPHSGHMNFRVPPEIHAKAAHAAALAGVSLTKWCQDVLKQAVTSK